MGLSLRIFRNQRERVITMTRNTTGGREGTDDYRQLTATTDSASGPPAASRLPERDYENHHERRRR